MSTLHVLYDDQTVVVRHIGAVRSSDILYINKHTDAEDIASQIYDILDDFAGSVNVEIGPLEDEE